MYEVDFFFFIILVIKASTLVLCEFMVINWEAAISRHRRTIIPKNNFNNQLYKSIILSEQLNNAKLFFIIIEQYAKA